jgi:phosphatidylinositol glycan class A protein
MQEVLSQDPKPSPLSIALVSDFFYPNLGGVEMHIYSLAYCLSELGHKVTIITKSYDNRQSVRYISLGIKCYYLPISSWPLGNIIYPVCTAGINLPLLRSILVREQITICHMHQTTSTLAIETSLYAWLMGITTVITDHSTWDLAGLGILDINKIWKLFQKQHHYICVSHAVRENYIVRSNLCPTNTSTIPNAIDCSKFKPDPTKRFP